MEFTPKPSNFFVSSHSFHSFTSFYVRIFFVNFLAVRFVFYFFVSLPSVKERKSLLIVRWISFAIRNFQYICHLIYGDCVWSSEWKESIHQRNRIESQPFLCTLIKTQLGQLFRFQWIRHSSLTHSLPSSLHARATCIQLRHSFLLFIFCRNDISMYFLLVKSHNW